MKDFRDLKVWENSHHLTLEIYQVTKTFPSEEKFGLISQIRRCAASVPANIAEGCGRRGNGEFSRFLQIATGSANELAYHWLLARDLGYVSMPDYGPVEAKIIEVQKMLAGLIAKVDSERFEAQTEKTKARGTGQ
jgi:four helix bundle protein